ncbi:MAG TPA: metallophosphoesterase [Solirubrobacteraceae bacterium]|jgi:predicted phosphodiesterase|nr:metallophosphoesterase [Solirubrobacteraceae bacterium]
MRTLIVSDLHLGSATRVDVLRHLAPRRALLEALDDVDRLVLLGDLLELRHGPRRSAMAAAQPFCEALGHAFGGREVIVLAGNHDHALVEPWLARRGELTLPAPLGIEQRFSAAEASPMLATLAEWAAPARVSAAYPGLWVREDVYATHGHYLDCHMRIPTMERLGIGAIGRLQRRPLTALAGADDYEAVSSPIYAWIDAMAQQARTGGALNGQGTVRAWRSLGGDRDYRPSRRRTMLRNRALAGAFPLVVAALNRAGIGPLQADISGPALRRAALGAMGEVVARLGVDGPDAHVIFGHTHRTGPLPRDQPSEWRAPGGARLHNSGCWTYDSYFLGGQPGENPYWPGGAILIEDDGPPVLQRLLSNHTQAELVPASLTPSPA